MLLGADEFPELLERSGVPYFKQAELPLGLVAADELLLSLQHARHGVDVEVQLGVRRALLHARHLLRATRAMLTAPLSR